MKFVQAIIVFLSLVSLAGSAIAAELGRTVFQGRQIILNDDNTWQYLNEDGGQVSGDCTPVKSDIMPITLCLNENEWQFANIGGDAEINLKKKDAELYLMVITENLFIERASLKEAIISNAQSASGLNKVAVLGEEAVSIDGQEMSRINYKTKVSGIDITYDNYYGGIEDLGSVQFVFFAGTQQFPAMASAIDAVMSNVKIDR